MYSFVMSVVVVAMSYFYTKTSVQFADCEQGNYHRSVVQFVIQIRLKKSPKFWSLRTSTVSIDFV